MDLFDLKNKATKDITKDELLFAIEELKIKNKTLELLEIVEDNGVLLAHINVFLKNSGQVNEKLRLGQLIGVIDSETSVADLTKMSDARNAKLFLNHKNNTKANEKRKATRQKNKPENNITKNGHKVSFGEMVDFLKDNVIETKIKRGERESFDSKFVSSIAQRLDGTNRKLTSKQHNCLCKVAKKHGFSMSEKVVRAKKKSSKTHSSSNIRCEHEDLGSLGHVHGSKVVCPQCGELVEVW